MPALSAPPRYTYLDLVRGLAAFSVILVHYRWFYATAPGDWGTSFSSTMPLRDILRPFYDHGGFAVQLFWLLSGAVFVIRYGGAPFDSKRFWIWRFARLYPLHIATLLLITAIQLVSLHITGRTTVYGNFDLYHFALQLVMASAWGLERGDSFNAPIWSVSVEILIYIVFFAYARTMRPTLARQLLMALVFSLIWIMLRSRWAQCGSLFFLGGALPLALVVGEKIASRLARLVAFSVFPVTCIALWTVSTRLEIYVPDIAYYYTLLPSLMVTTLACDATMPALPHGMRWIGGSTYATYLMHMPILIAMKIVLDLRADRLDILASPVMLLVYASTVIGTAVLVHRLFERKMQHAIQRRWDARPVPGAIGREEQRTI
ncbi:acyltransferase family protein [Sphingomonas sanguinis]|nr:acyltransferase [Sphingomonas sanguinis]